MQEPIRLVVGLGNPGSEHAGNRHNVGFWLLQLLACQYGGQFKAESKFHGAACRVMVDGSECWLLQPATFMNRSGQAVSSLARYFKIAPEQMLVVHDELDLPVGTTRLKWSGGSGGHNGLKDIISAMNGPGFWRLRVGIGHPGDSRLVTDYVLKNPSRSDENKIMETLEEAAALFPQLLSGEQQQVMHRLHSDE